MNAQKERHHAAWSTLAGIESRVAIVRGIPHRFRDHLHWVGMPADLARAETPVIEPLEVLGAKLAA